MKGNIHVDILWCWELQFASSAVHCTLLIRAGGHSPGIAHPQKTGVGQASGLGVDQGPEVTDVAGAEFKLFTNIAVAAFVMILELDKLSVGGREFFDQDAEDADGFHANEDALRVQAIKKVLETSAFLSYAVMLRYCQVLDEHLV